MSKRGCVLLQQGDALLVPKSRDMGLSEEDERLFGDEEFF
jgi:hypothetical protein